jgi:SAM-dependent methyltransferase
MFRATRDAVQAFAEVFRPQGPVLELGSYQHLGLGAYTDVRPFFPGKEYVGTDIRSGPGVDRLEDAERLSFDDASFGTVLAFDILEHLRHPREAVAEAHRVLRDDGLFAVAVPCSYRIHGFPADYWRFTASGLHTLFAGFEGCVVFALGPQLNPPLVFGVAAKAGGAEFRRSAQLFRECIAHVYGSRRSRLRGQVSIARRLGRDSLGWLLGRAHVGVWFFDPDEASPYEPHEALQPTRRAT